MCLALTLVVVSCDPTEAGPDLPRPSQTHSLPPATTTPTTTSTVEAETAMSEECPTDVCLVYRINRRARWSDDVPVSPADFVATVAAHRDPLAAGRDPAYDLIASVDAIDARTVRVALTEPYGAWEGLFSRLIPAHVTDPDPGSLPATGPFVFDEWVPGDRIVVQRNDDWWTDVDPLSGDKAGSVDQIEFVFIADQEDLLASVESGSVDVAATRPTPEILERLSESSETVHYTLEPGPFWEHIDYHHQGGMLSQTWVREMLDLAIDRQKILDRTVRLLNPTAAPLNNAIWMRNMADYQSHYVDRHDPVAAEQLLIDHECIREAETYVCGNRPMSFVWLSTNDDPDRQAIVESVTEDLAGIGVEIVPDLRTPSAFVNRDVLFGGPDVWQLVNFSWRAGSDPSTADPTFFCGDSDLNVNRYCSPEVESLVRAAQTTLNPAERAALYNRADRLYLEDLALIPLYQKPELLMWSTRVDGPAPNFSTSTDLWNIGSWTGGSSIVVALSSEPGSLDPVSIADGSANLVLATMLYGAFGMDPSHEHVPVLIDSVEIVEG